MDNELYKISSKVGMKWFSWGNIKKGEKGYRGGIRKTPEFMKLINELPDNAFFNFLLFADKPKPDYKPAVNQQGQAVAAGGNIIDDLSDDNEIPF